MMEMALQQLELKDAHKSSQIIPTNIPAPIFTGRIPSCRPTNNVLALKRDFSDSKNTV